ncbi:carbonic anhydrase [Novosphingopyxis sp. YJ-S2-01]|uniref:carbonic anhydrase n=1 Tax=Novosphingopyxis sp. YJ-S2-01 TaxID=2794021 RepID=UPI0018DB5AC5|nr:carbonic anhydrase [Novosphingopyxis sp. YJ-S2-01]MBH9537990.1 carbonic anhydrase [Novosphingopyxis sp. YJ-S2-01]
MTDFNDMIEGYRGFYRNDWEAHRQRWEELTEGQSPQVMVISCSDSRVDPALVFNSKPGEIFVVRNVAALVPPFETSPGFHGVSAAIEFAVQFLKVPEIVVMGHGRCGGCNAALTGNVADTGHGEGAHIADWVRMLRDAKKKVADEYGTEGRDAGRAMELAGVRVSLNNLMTFPYVAEKVEKGELKLQGAYFAIEDGELHVLNKDSDQFETVR